MVASALAWEEIRLEDIWTAMQHGDSLYDLWADYAPEFLVWFREKYKDIFDPWLEGAKSYLDDWSPIDDAWINNNQGIIASTLLFAFSNNWLGKHGITPSF
jgi:hypothetical protein